MEYVMYSCVANWLYTLTSPLTYLACEYTLWFLKRQSNGNTFSVSNCKTFAILAYQNNSCNLERR
jgi:hypothetical protein